MPVARLCVVVAERGSVSCAGLRGAADRYARRNVPLGDRPADCGAIARKARGPACRRGANLVHLRRCRSLQSARSGGRHLALGRVLGDRALLRSDNDAPASLAARPVPAPLRVVHGVSALALIIIFLARRILRPRASRGWGACGHYGAWRQQGVSRPIHDQRRGRRRDHCLGDHARHVRDARPVHLKRGDRRKETAPSMRTSAFASSARCLADEMIE